MSTTTSKQDRQGVRTAVELEQKYNFGQSFADVFGLASDAQKVAETAYAEVTVLDTLLDSEEIFNRLTDYGAQQGMYRDSSGNIYFNASYVKSGTLSADVIGANSITTEKIDSLAVTSSKIAADAITATHIAADAVTAEAIKTGAVMADAIATGAVTSTAIYSSAITTDKIAVGAVTTNKIAAGAVTATEIAAGAITAEKLAAGAITAEFIESLGVSASILKGSYIYIKNSSGTTTAYMSPGSTTSAGIEIQTYGEMYLAGSTGHIHLTGGDVIVNGSSGGALHPTSYAIDLGTASSGTFTDCYLYGSVTNLSDQNKKNSIEDLSDEYLALFDALTPRRFKLNDGTSGRYHVGFIAQEVEEAIAAAGLDTQQFAGFVRDVNEETEEEICYLRYTEFIALAVEKIKRLEQRIAALEGTS